MARILVTGGAGFIGSHVVDACLAAGHQVAVVDDLSSGLRKFVSANAAFHECDIRDAKLHEVFSTFKPEVVLHLAAQMDVRKSLEYPGHDASVNIVGGLNVLEACREYGANKIIFSSTGGAIYGEPETLPADEDCPARPMSHYGTSKRAFELYLPLYERLYGLRYTILRFPNVYGPRQNPHGEAGVCAIFIAKLLKGEAPVLYGHGAPLRDYVYVEDIARGCLLALDKGDGATLNLGSGKGVSVRELFETLKALMGVELDAKELPLRTGEVDKIYTTGERAKAVLGWTPDVKLEEGLQRTIDWVKQRP